MEHQYEVVVRADYIAVANLVLNASMQTGCVQQEGNMKNASHSMANSCREGTSQRVSRRVNATYCQKITYVASFVHLAPSLDIVLQYLQDHLLNKGQHKGKGS